MLLVASLWEAMGRTAKGERSGCYISLALEETSLCPSSDFGHSPRHDGHLFPCGVGCRIAGQSIRAPVAERQRR